MAASTFEEYRTRDSTYQTQYDVSDPDSILISIIEATATVTETPPSQLEPLVETIDPDALATLVRSADQGVVVEFLYHGHRVAVCSEGDIVVTAA